MFVLTANKKQSTAHTFTYVRGFGGCVFMLLCRVLALAGWLRCVGLVIACFGFFRTWTRRKEPMELSWLSFFLYSARADQNRHWQGATKKKKKGKRARARDRGMHMYCAPTNDEDAGLAATARLACGRRLYYARTHARPE